MITSDIDVTQGGSRPNWRTTVEAGVTVHWCAVPYQNAMPYGERLKAFGRFAYMSAWRAASLDQDVVLATSTPLTVALPGAYSAFRRHVPMVLEVRDLWPEVPIALGALTGAASHRAAWGLEAWAYRRASHIIALSPDMTADIRRRFPGAQVTTIPNSSDIELFDDAAAGGLALRAATPWLGNRPLILYAGTLGQVNGPEYVVRMAAELKRIDPELRIAIVGSGREQTAARQLARELDVLDENLFMLPSVPKREVINFFGACDVSLSTVINVPALSANSPNKVFDAFAAGRPVAINHGGWLEDVITTSGAGVVLPASSPSGAASIMSNFLRDSDGLQKAKKAAGVLGTEQFSRDGLFRQLEKVLYSVGAQRR